MVEMSVITCMPEASRQALVIDAAPCEYIYDSDPRITPQRIFKTSTGEWAQDGRGFPDQHFDPVNLTALRPGMRGYFNCEHYAPSFHETAIIGGKPVYLPGMSVNLAMRSKGMFIHGSRECAETNQVGYIIHRCRAIKEVCGSVGAYNFYPFEGISDRRAMVLQFLDVWTPPLYVARNLAIPNLDIPLAPDIMPPKPVEPAVCLLAENWDLVGQTSWMAVFEKAQQIGAKGVLLWGALADAKLAAKGSEFMVNGATMAGVKLALKHSGPPDHQAPVEPAE